MILTYQSNINKRPVSYNDFEILKVVYEFIIFLENFVDIVHIR